MTEPSDEDISRKLEELKSRVHSARSEAGLLPREDRPRTTAAPNRMELGFRIALEMVVCTMVGGGMGYGIDAWLVSRPWGMSSGLLIGFAAGILTVYRVVKGLDEAVGLGRATREAAQSKPDDENRE